MTIGILMSGSKKDEGFTSVERLEQAVLARGAMCVRVHEPELVFSKNGTDMEVTCGNVDLKKIDVLIYRPNFVEEPGLHGHVLELLKEHGVCVLNGNADGVALSKNKLAQHVAFSRAGLPMPRWAIARDAAGARAAVERMGLPVVIKTAFGTHGTGVFFADSLETFLPIAEYLAVRDKNPMIIEEFVAETERKDLRVFIVGGKMVAAMERMARPGDVRANASIGGSSRTVELTTEEKTLALRVADVCVLEILGIDLLRTKQGPVVIEVNANPGFEALERTTGIDIAGAIVEEAIQTFSGSSAQREGLLRM